MNMTIKSSEVTRVKSQEVIPSSPPYSECTGYGSLHYLPLLWEEGLG